MADVEGVAASPAAPQGPTRASRLAKMAEDVRELELSTGKTRVALVRVRKLIGNVHIPHDQVLGAARDEGFEEASEEIFSLLTQENLALPEGEEVYIGIPTPSGDPEGKSRPHLLRVTSDGESNYGDIVPVKPYSHANLCEPHWLYAFKVPDE